MKKQRKNPRRRRFFIPLLLAVLLGLWVFSTFTLKVTRVTLEDAKIRDAVKIVLISDLHGARFGRNNRALIQKIQKENPDFIVAAGDMYSAYDEQGKARAVDLLGRLAEEFPVYYVNGEHDHQKSFWEELRKAGVHVLDYESEKIAVNNTKITLYGITNVYYSPTFDLTREFSLDEESYTILAAHAQNLEDFARFGVDLALCGDTHGGQVRLPFLGAAYGEGGWFPEWRGGMTKGLYFEGDTTLFITSGLGNYPIPLRFLNRPEVAVLTLLPKS